MQNKCNVCDQTTQGNTYIHNNPWACIAALKLKIFELEARLSTLPAKNNYPFQHLFCGEIDPNKESSCYLIPNHEGDCIGYSKKLQDNIYWNRKKEVKEKQIEEIKTHERG